MAVADIEMRLADDNNLPDAAGVRGNGPVLLDPRSRSQAERGRSGKYAQDITASMFPNRAILCVLVLHT
jgi:hypothetical protein